MKKSELRHLIREEIYKSLQEGGLSTTTFKQETVDKIWDAIKTLCDSSEKSVSYENSSLIRLYNATSEKWDYVSQNSDKLKIGQISATTFSLLVMITKGNIVKGYFEIAPYDTLKQKFKPGKVYISAVTDNQLSNPRISAHKKIVYQA